MRYIHCFSLEGRLLNENLRIVCKWNAEGKEMGGGVPALYVVLQGKMAQDCLGYVTYDEIR